MQEPDDFIDHYEILHVTPQCDATALEAAYRFYAKMYHPDHVDTADVEKFNEVIAAYRTLRDPALRAKYDISHAARRPRAHQARDTRQGDDDSALNDADMQEKVLVYLYKRRRENPADPGLGSYMLQEFMGCSVNHFEFHMWYLREKGFLGVTEQGTYAITIQGIDHVITQSRQSATEKLLLAETSRRID
jgi:curved DNA-binding protein